MIEEVDQANGNDSVDGGREYIGNFYRDLSDECQNWSDGDLKANEHSGHD